MDRSESGARTNCVPQPSAATRRRTRRSTVGTLNMDYVLELVMSCPDSLPGDVPCTFHSHVSNSRARGEPYSKHVLHVWVLFSFRCSILVWMHFRCHFGSILVPFWEQNSVIFGIVFYITFICRLKSAQDRPKTAHEAPRGTLKAPNGTPKAPKTTQKAPRRALKAFKTAKKRQREAPMSS